MNDILTLPIYSAFAAIFWAWLAVCAIYPAARHRFAELLIPVPATNQSHLPGLDALRGLTALFIAVFHTWQWSQPAFSGVFDAAPIVARGYRAVPIFVALSGLLIYRSVANAYDFADLKRYAVRRFLRIFPVYFATVCIAFLLITPSRPDAFSFQYFIGETFMLRSLGLASFVNPPAWGLYVEVLFYMTIPMFVICARPRPLVWAAVAFVVFAIGDAVGPREMTLWKFFACGIIAAELIKRWNGGAIASTICATIGLVITIYDIRYSPETPPYFTLKLCLGVTLLLVGIVRSPAFRYVMESWPLRMLGAVSYSLFMWHSFLITANFPVTFEGTGGVATLSHMPTISGISLIVIAIPAMLAAATISFLILERPFLVRRRVTSSSDVERPSSAMI